MPGGKMHADEMAIDAELVRHLLLAQYPDWAQLPLAPVESAGTDNALYRLGKDMVVRLPRIASATAQVHKEHQWLPRLAPHLPLTIPTPLVLGAPGIGYPWSWSIYRWLDGDNALQSAPEQPHQAARTIAQFISALQGVDSSDGPLPGAHNFGRGVPLAERDNATRQAIAELGTLVDAPAVIAIWESALHASVWAEPPVWIHGDLQAGNLLVHHGRISSVIDFGGLAVGDPACDLMIAWTYLSADTRRTFRAALAIDDATWTRGRGWALSFAVIALPYYQHTNPALAGIARRTIDELLSDGGVA